MRVLRTAIAIGLAFLFFLPGEALCQSFFRTPGAASFVVPAGVFQIRFGAYGAGDFNGTLGSRNGGASGGFCQITKSVTPGQTVFLQVADGSGAPSALSSWININSNTQPASSSDGCLAQGQNSNVADCAGVCTGLFGDINTSGVAHAGPTTGPGTGGGGGGGPGGNGSPGTVPLGGAGGAAANGLPAGGSGGNGNTSPSINLATSGSQPGGGGGGAFNSGTAFPSGGGGGSNGLVVAIFLVVPPPSSGACHLFLTWPG